jgi:hypothetical protein
MPSTTTTTAEGGGDIAKAHAEAIRHTDWWKISEEQWSQIYRDYLPAFVAALAAQSPPSRGDGTAEGWVMLPREPTEEMIAAAQAECHRMAGVIDPVMHVWDAFLAAAPAAPSATDGEDAQRRIAYAEQRRDLYINEAQRLALLVRKLGGDPEAPSATDGETEAEKPCHWGGGNDVIWCSTCGEEYAYAKGESRPLCPREVPASVAGGGDGGLAGQKPVAWSSDMAAAPRDGTVILLWKDGWGDPSPAYWGLAPKAYSEVATKRHPWTFLDETNGLNGFEDGADGPSHWRRLPSPPSSQAPAAPVGDLAGLSEPYEPLTIYYPDSDVIEYLLTDSAHLYREIGHGAALVLDMDGRHVVGFRIQSPKTWLSALLLPAAHRQTVTEEEIARAIRNALTENWVEDGWKKWDEDVLLTGCKKVGGGKGYDNPKQAADALTKDAARAVLALLSASPDAVKVEAPDGWQPIETAPRNGTWVLISGGDVSEACHAQDEYETRGGPAVAAFWQGDEIDDEAGWWSYAFWDMNWRSSFERPTHWRPLPASPDAVQTNGGER